MGERMRSIDAALVGTDSLIVVDEAHLSAPFLTTLRDALAINASAVGELPTVVTMSASPDSEDRDVHGISRADEEHAVASVRLLAPKSLHTVSVSSSGTGAAAATAEALTYWALQLGGPGKVIGVVANTVAMAREVFELLRGEMPDKCCVLLTGRVRPLDREYLLAAWYPRIKSFAERDPEAELYVVATQTIEAGADIDVDGLVTQAGSLPATVQRLGRLNRLGRRGESHAVVVRAEKLADHVYGPAADETWAWLTKLAEPKAHQRGLALGALALAGVSPSRLRGLVKAIPAAQQERMRGQRPYVLVLSDAALSAWARTSPAPDPDAPVAPYLHGIGAAGPTVLMAWRGDLQGDDPQEWIANVERMPPIADEAIEIPISALRRWLASFGNGKGGQSVAPALAMSDLESERADGLDEANEAAASSARLLRFRGTDESEAVCAADIGPGDFLIAKSSWGGCDRYGWNPGSPISVVDVADFAGGSRRGAVVRVSQTLVNAVRELTPELTQGIEGFVSEITADLDEEIIDNKTYQRILNEAIRDDKRPASSAGAQKACEFWRAG